MSNKQYRKNQRRLRWLQITAIGLLLCVIAVTALGCTGEILGEETGPTNNSNESESTGFTIGDNVDPLAFMNNAEHKLYVECLNTGKSDCILIRMDDKVILMDAADDDDYTLIRAKLTEYNIDTIDYLIITHYDNDHIGAADRVLRDYTVHTVYAPDYVRNSGDYRDMMQAVEQVGTRTDFQKITSDVELDLGFGQVWINPTSLEGYEPGKVMANDTTHATIQENNFSLMTVVRFGEATVVLPGDAEDARVAEWVPQFEEKYGSTLKGPKTFIKIPHHGSYDQGTAAILQSVAPWYCAVCSDQMSVESNLIGGIQQNSGAAVYYTYRGTVLFATDGTSCGIRQS